MSASHTPASTQLPEDGRDAAPTGSSDPELAPLVGELLALVDGFAPAAVRHDLEEGLSRLEGGRVNLVVLGEFKRGKSTLVNALVEEAIVPTGVVPLTAAVTILRHGRQPRLLVRFRDGDEREFRLERIADFGTENGNPHNRREVQIITVELPAPLLASGLQLVDTPGIGSVYAHNTETALGFLGQVDAALFTLAADQPVSEAEAELVRQAAERIPKIFFAVNKIDHLSTGDRAESVRFIHDRLADMLSAEPELYAVSATSGEGLPKLRSRLEHFAAAERQSTVEHSLRSLARHIATEAEQAVRFEAQAASIPLAQLERKLAEFADRSARLLTAQEEAAALLREGTSRLVAGTIDEPLLTLARREAPAAVDDLRALAADCSSLPPRQLARRLEAWIDQTVSSRFRQRAEELEQQVADGLSELHARYAERVDTILAELDRAAEDVFGARAGRRAPELSLRQPSRFTFKLHDEREPLDQLVSFASASLPGPIGRRLVRREGEERLRMLLDRHAGRLRSDLAARVRASADEYTRELAFVVRQAAESIEATVDRAAHEQRAGQARLAAHLEQLTRREASIRAIGNRLAAGG